MYTYTYMCTKLLTTITLELLNKRRNKTNDNFTMLLLSLSTNKYLSTAIKDINFMVHYIKFMDCVGN